MRERLTRPEGGASRSPHRIGLLGKFREAILGCAHAIEVHSPLEGESKRPSPWAKADSVGDMPQKSSPHRFGFGKKLPHLTDSPSRGE